MTTDRPYKTRRIFCDVIEDFRRNTGKQFDCQVVLALCRALLKEMNGTGTDRRMTKMLGKNYLEAERDTPYPPAHLGAGSQPTISYGNGLSLASGSVDTDGDGIGDACELSDNPPPNGQALRFMLVLHFGSAAGLRHRLARHTFDEFSYGCCPQDWWDLLRLDAEDEVADGDL